MAVAWRTIISLVLIVSAAAINIAAAPNHYCNSTDSVSAADTGKVVSGSWVKQLIASGFHINSPSIHYPKFPRFVVKVYNWGDKLFNSYDSTYVVGTGKNWKVMSKSYNWMESYMMLFSAKSSDMLHIRSDIFYDLGAYISFMAVSVGYTSKVNSWFGDAGNDRKNLNFNFTCSRLYANFDFTSTKGNARITHFGEYNKGRSFSHKFDDITHKSLTGEFYYFFNNKKYSQAAAYCYSKYQLKSAGSWILGFAFNSQRIDLDFSSLPMEMQKFLPSLASDYRFHYTDYGILGGYGHNWALSPKKWLINFTILPSMGYRHSYSDSTEGRKSMVSTNVRARFAVVYNHKAIFASLNGRFDAHLYFNSKYAFFNSTEALSLIVGARF